MLSRSIGCLLFTEHIFTSKDNVTKCTKNEMVRRDGNSGGLKKKAMDACQKI